MAKETVEVVTEAAVMKTAKSMKKAKPSRATFEMMMDKPRATTEASFYFEGPEGREEVSLEFRAIGAIQYDKLISKCPPNTEQRAEGASYNIHTFGPELLGVVCVEPSLTVAQWKEIWNSPDWNRGEIVQLFGTALELCNRGLDIPFTKTD